MNSINAIVTMVYESFMMSIKTWIKAIAHKIFWGIFKEINDCFTLQMFNETRYTVIK